MNGFRSTAPTFFRSTVLSLCPFRFRLTPPACRSLLSPSVSLAFQRNASSRSRARLRALRRRRRGQRENRREARRLKLSFNSHLARGLLQKHDASSPRPLRGREKLCRRRRGADPQRRQTRQGRGDVVRAEEEEAGRGRRGGRIRKEENKAHESPPPSGRSDLFRSLSLSHL